jgi:tetratricopeptide (TPR) repeat protein
MRDTKNYPSRSSEEEMWISVAYGVMGKWKGIWTSIEKRLSILTLFKGLGLIATFAVIIRVLVLSFSPTIQLDPFVVPADLEKAGFSSQAFTNELVDQIAALKDEANTFAEKDTVLLDSQSELPDIQIPASTLSLRSIVQFVQEFVRFQPSRVGGEVTLNPWVRSPDGVSQTLKITIRVQRGDDRVVSQLYLMPNDPVNAVAQSAAEIIKMVDPYLAAVRLYEAGQSEAALNVANGCRGHRAKWAWILRGNVYDDDKNEQMAMFAYNQALFGTKPDCRKYWLWLSRDSASACSVAYYDRGLILAEEGRYNEAITDYREATHLDGRNTDAYEEWSWALFDDGDYEGAIRTYRKAHNTSTAIYKNWGAQLLDEHDYDAAAAMYRAASELHGEDADALNGLGNALYFKGDYAGAAAVYEKATKVSTDNTAAYYNWGNALYRERDYDGAIVKFKKALSFESSNSAAEYVKILNNLGISYMYSGDFDQARGYFNEALTKCGVTANGCKAVEKNLELFNAAQSAQVQQVR